LNALSGVLRSALDALAARPSALITDIDGTISPIVLVPDQATVGDTIKECLASLRSRLDLVAVITAREEPVARRMIGLDGLTYVGNYALDGDHGGWAGYAGALASAKQALVSMPCVAVEEKGVSFALHYRNCEDAGVREQLMSLAQPLADGNGGKLLQGKKVIELVPRSLPDKGTAIGRLIDEHGIRGLVYLGDDISDIAVFRELARRSDRDGLKAAGIAVVDDETDDEVRQSATLHLDGVTQVEEFLLALRASLAREEN
jgi:trehalose 6-phosphate phosphatase